MTSTLRRAGGFAAVGSLALAAPALGPAAAAPFVAIALLAAFVVSDGPLFELFARPGDHEDGRLNGLAGFALAATGLALLATVPRMTMPVTTFVAAVFVVAYGNLGASLVGAGEEEPFRRTAAFATAGFLAAFVGQAAVAWPAPQYPELAFLAASGALVAALFRSLLFGRDDPLVMLSVGILLWLLGVLVGDVPPLEVAAALSLTILLGYISYALGAASLPGMLTGVFLVLLSIVLGGVGWFAALITFFGVGALSTKFGYERKRSQGVAEDNEGARGTGNVLGNAAVALVALVGFAATPHLAVDATPFVYAFAGSLATALADTLSSEIGGLFEEPRLVTTFEPVRPGTDGAITWQGELAGGIGAALVALVAVALLPVEGVVGGVVVAVGGVAGMTADSFLGATLEGNRLGNQGVNFVATLVGALVSAALALLVL